MPRVEIGFGTIVQIINRGKVLVLQRKDDKRFDGASVNYTNEGEMYIGVPGTEMFSKIFQVTEKISLARVFEAARLGGEISGWGFPEGVEASYRQYSKQKRFKVEI
jgi:hypothetical protein